MRFVGSTTRRPVSRAENASIPVRRLISAAIVAWSDPIRKSAAIS